MSAESCDEPTAPPNLGDRLLLLVVAAVIAGFSTAALCNAWVILVTGHVECPYLQPDGALLRQVHIWIHVIGNSLSGGLFLIVAVAQVLRATAPVRLERMTRRFLSGRLITLAVGTLLVFWGYELAEITYQAFGLGRSDFFWFEGPRTMLTGMRFYAHAVGIALMAASLSLFGLALLIRSFLPQRRFALVLYLAAPGLVTLLLGVVCGALCVLGALLNRVL
ncbi:MAG: hypothetical protein GX616_21990 [Planctomycetes bacterium]|nr:hypothetical protein [Planctomycetota bacterium]